MTSRETVDHEPPARLPDLERHHSLLHDLRPKGACWYCNAPLDNVKRFCNKACAEDYQNEEEIFR